MHVMLLVSGLRFMPESTSVITINFVYQGFDGKSESLGKLTQIFHKYLAIMLLPTHLNEYFQRVSKSINVASFNDTVSGLPGID